MGNAKYEYMLNYWGKNKEKVNGSLGLPTTKESTFLFFDTKEERDKAASWARTIAPDGLATRTEEGMGIRNRLIVEVRCSYEEKPYHFFYDYGHGYSEDAARFMFEEGNYSCDCNMSSFLKKIHPEFPELKCALFDIDVIRLDELIMHQVTPDNLDAFRETNQAFLIGRG